MANPAHATHMNMKNASRSILSELEDFKKAIGWKIYRRSRPLCD